MNEIKSLKAREISDSRGVPTIEVALTAGSGVFLASVPSGVSRGKYEAVAKKAKVAVNNINKIIGPKLAGKDPRKQKEIDEFLIKLDGTRNKSYLGANAILAASIASLRAGAVLQGLPLWKWISKIADTKPSLPAPCVLFIEGGLHGKGEAEIQEFMLAFPAKTFKERLKTSINAFDKLRKVLKKNYGKKGIRLGTEGAFTPPLRKTGEVLDLLKKIGRGKKAKIIVDAAASTFFKKGRYCLEGKKLDRKELLDFYLKLCQKYPIMGIEDPFYQEDWLGFQKITKILGKKIAIIGDDLLATNLGRIKTALSRKACNGLILKPNQIGTVSETIMAAKYAMKNNWKVFVKHRGGETCDDFISDLAVGLGAGWIMAGGPTKKERMAKYNRLIQIEKEILK